jgi:hypothetical protein
LSPIGDSQAGKRSRKVVKAAGKAIKPEKKTPDNELGDGVPSW